MKIVKKTWDERLDNNVFLESDVDEQLLMFIPFVNLHSFGENYALTQTKQKFYGHCEITLDHCPLTPRADCSQDCEDIH